MPNYPTAHLALCEAHYQIGLAFRHLRTDEQWQTTMHRESLQKALDAIQDALSATEDTTVEERRALDTIPPVVGPKTDPAPPMDAVCSSVFYDNLDY